MDGRGSAVAARAPNRALPTHTPPTYPPRPQGWADRATGEVCLDFRADFFFTGLFGIYAPPAIEVTTTLTTGSVAGSILRGKGARLGPDGVARLAGIAAVKPTGDGFLDWFLRAPTECLAELSAEFEFGA